MGGTLGGNKFLSPSYCGLGPRTKRKTGSKGNARARVALMIIFSSRKPFPSLQPTPASKGKHTAKPKIARIFLANLVLDFLPNPVGG